MDDVVEAVFPTLASLLTVYLRISGGYFVESDAPTFYLWLKIGPALGTAIVIGLVLLILLPFGHVSFGRHPPYSLSNKGNQDRTDDAVDGTESPNHRDENWIDTRSTREGQNHLDKLGDTDVGNKPVSNGFVIRNPEFYDDDDSEDVKTDDDGLTMTIAAETRNSRSDFKPITISRPCDMNDSGNPFPAYLDVVPVENIPPPKPQRVRSVTVNSNNTMSMAKASPIPVAPTLNPNYVPLKRRSNAQRPQNFNSSQKSKLDLTQRQNSSQEFDDELKRALERVRTRSSITTNRNPRVNRPISFPASTSSLSSASMNFDDELKVALSARRSAMNANVRREPNVDLRLARTSESLATSTIDEGNESNGSVSLNCDNGSSSDSDASSYSSHTAVTRLPNTFYSLPRHSLSTTDLRVISEFSQTMEKLKQRMKKEDAMALESSISSINRIVGGPSTRGSERGKSSGSGTEV